MEVEDADPKNPDISSILHDGVQDLNLNGLPAAEEGVPAEDDKYGAYLFMDDGVLGANILSSDAT